MIAISTFTRNSASAARMNRRRSMSRNSPPNSAYLQRYTILTSSRLSTSSKTRTSIGARLWNSVLEVTCTLLSRKGALDPPYSGPFVNQALFTSLRGADDGFKFYFLFYAFSLCFTCIADRWPSGMSVVRDSPGHCRQKCSFRLQKIISHASVF